MTGTPAARAWAAPVASPSGVRVSHRCLPIGALCAALLALSGCGAGGAIGSLIPQIDGGSAGPAAPGSVDAAAVWRDDVRLTLTGILAEADPARDATPQCPVLVLDDGRIYALVGDLGRSGLGDRIEVTGPPAAWSTCQTYQVLRADEVELLQAWTPR